MILRPYVSNSDLANYLPGPACRGVRQPSDITESSVQAVHTDCHT